MAVHPTRRNVLRGMAAFAGALAAPGLLRAAGMRRVIRIGTVNPAASATGQACRGFAEAVAASPVLAEAFQVEVHANGELGGELEMTKACINGSLDLAVTASNVVAVPRSATISGRVFVRPYRSYAARLLAMRSAPTSAGFL